MTQIKLLAPDIPGVEALTPWLRRIEEARWYSNFGPIVQEFEQEMLEEFKRFHKRELFLTTVCNCTIGLELALSSLALRQNARVLIPSLTYVATATAVKHAGYQPVVADIDLEKWQLTPEIAREALDYIDIDVVMPVASFGLQQHTKGWDIFTRETGIPVIIDAAGAFGNQRVGEKTIVVFSLHATKPFGIGEGGIVICRDKNFIERVRRTSNFGIIPDGSGLVVHPGINGKMSEFQAAVGMAMLPYWPQKAEKLITLRDYYNSRMASLGHPVTLQKSEETYISMMYNVAFESCVNIGALIDFLKTKGIETRRWYFPPIFEHPAFVDIHHAGRLQNVRKIAYRMLGLPFHTYLKKDDVDYVCDSIKEFLGGAK